ncbi:hypothetical protein D9758_000014 [Tetrapyrgos nigripes]|uniref:RIC1 C-terminal alpha solenoid region domain-containing protein n=1 Tax=Tetrapyrgos nigripes TaxID=182062 RepID=A0A8H5H1X3_9AGAR|nr:hypothetical protein D9758_000014 [Tetrapyrgos nigripes]
MYFPTSTARQLSTIPALPNLPPEPVLDLCPSPKKSLFCTLTRNGLSVWRVRPSALLAFLSRTPTSIIDHGENRKAHWSPDGNRVTSESYLVLVSVIYSPDEPVYQIPPLPVSARRNFLAGPGEGFPLNAIHLHFEGVVRIEGTLLSLSPRKDCIYLSTRNPPSIQRIPWPSQGEDEAEEYDAGEHGRRRRQFTSYDNWVINEYDFHWLIEHEVSVSKILFSRATGVETWITSDGRAYFVHLTEVPVDVQDYEEGFSPEDDTRARTPRPGRRSSSSDAGFPQDDDVSYTEVWQGMCVHDFDTPKWVQKQRRIDPDEPLHQRDRKVYVEPKRAVLIAVNAKFSLIAVGMLGGGIQFTNFPSQEGVLPASQTIEIPNAINKATGAVCAMEWSSDGYVLAVGWEHGWGIFSVGGRCLVSAFGADDVDDKKFQDVFMNGVSSLFWAPGNFELIILSRRSLETTDGQLFVIPFAKSATTGQHSPDNTRYAFLQLDDRALVYRGADQPDMSVINPESDVWQHIEIPQTYLAANWPIRYSSLSSDGRLIAVAGRRGLIHFSASSGRWKVFSDEIQEQAFAVKGGLIWFHHVLIAAVEVSRTYQIRLYSRDLELSNQNVLHREIMSAPVVILSLVDNTLLVYSADNTLSHFLIVPTPDTIKLHLCAQKQLGDPVNDLAVATVLMVVGGQLVLLRPRKSADQEVRYDMQIFADRVEFCWIHLRGITSLENSLWAFDGKGIRVWLNALAIEAPNSAVDGASVKESVNIPLEFYPLSVLMDKGIIIGAEHEAATRPNLSFVMFRHATSSHLFLHHILKYHLEASQVKEAVAFASHYQNLVYFAHALEILLHTVVESDATTDNESDTDDSVVLSNAVEFLDHFDAALDVVVGCARKTEVTRWRRLFDIVGNPKNLFETCLVSGRLKTAGSYLLVLHNLEQLDEKNGDATRLLQSALEAKDWQLCRELVRFLHSIDDTGAALRHALVQTDVMDIDMDDTTNVTV